MEPTQVYIAIFIAVLAILASVFIMLKKNRKTVPITPLSSLALLSIVAGIVFGRIQVLGYGFIGIGAVLAIADAVIKTRHH